MTKSRLMRDLLANARPLLSPGAFDGYSLRLVEAMGYKSASTSGAGLANSLLGQPDIGILSLSQNVDACRHLARSVSIPLMADADTGYGNAVTVYHVVQYFEEAGVVGINLEDQVMPKRCGHMRGKDLVDPREMAKKIEAAVKAKKDPDFIINARTDAIAVEGIEGAIARLKTYAAAGADMVYPDAVRSEDDICRVLDAFPDVPVSINMGFGIRSRPTTPLVSLRRLAALGVARVTAPRMLTAAALAGMRKALELMRGSGRLVFIVPAMIGPFAVLTMVDREGGPPTTALVILMTFTVGFFISTIMPLGLRTDLQHIEAIKALPIRASSVVWGSIISAILYVTAIQLLAVAGLAVMHSGWTPDTSLALALAVPINLLMIASDGVLVILFPSVRRFASGDILVGMRLMLVNLAKAFFILASVGVASLGAFATQLIWGESLPVMAAVGGAVLLLEGCATVWLGAWLFDRYDPSAHVVEED